MAIQTLDLGELGRKANTIYEACLVIAKRARDINADRISKRKEKEILEETGYDQDLDVYDREFFEGVEYEREINPTVIAQQELIEGKIKYHYITEDEPKLIEETPSE